MKRIFLGLAALLAALACLAVVSPAVRGGGSPGPDLSDLRAVRDFPGKIVFQSDLGGSNRIYVLTRDRLRELPGTPGSDEFPKWSPDGKRVAFMANPDGRFQIFVVNEDGSGLKQVSHSRFAATEAAWYPDGRRLCYTEERRRGLRKSYTLITLDLATGAESKTLPDFGRSSSLAEFSPDGSLMAFTGGRLIGWAVFIHDFRTGETRVLTEGGGACRPHFSPDGKRIAFVSSEADKKGDIWLINPDGTGKERLTDLPETFDYYPSWSPDGKFIVFASGTEHYPYQGTWSLKIVEVATGKVFPLFSSGGRDVFPDWR
jgi:Tol biopolymer transport system component